MPLRKYQLQAIEKVESFFEENPDKRRVLLVSPTGCHRAGQPLLMASGKVTRVEDVKVGDALLGMFGLPRIVQQLCRGTGAMYEITPDHGEPFVVNSEHLLSLLSSMGHIIDVSVTEWLEFCAWNPYAPEKFKLFRVGDDFSESSIVRLGFKVKPVGVESYYGFTLDGDGRYLLGDRTVTHNSGKTATAVEAVKRAVNRGENVLWLAHRRELITQASDRMTQEGIPDHGICLAGHPEGVKDSQVQIASVDTLRARKIRPPADIIIWDEAHRVFAPSFKLIQSEYSYSRHLGLTATPCRGDGAPLGDVFDKMIVAATIPQLQKAGFLVPCRIIAPRKSLNSREIAKDPLLEYQARAKGKQTVIFMNTLEECYATAQNFQDVGIAAEVVEANTPPQIRSDILRKFKEREINVLCNVSVLTEGWDDPGAEVGIIARSVGNLGLWMQIVGRFLRPCPQKEFATILDLAGNVHQHGLPEAEVTFSLDGGINQLKHQTLLPCPYCGVMISTLPCAHCGQGQAPIRPKSKRRILDHEIFEILRPAPKFDGRDPDRIWREDALYLARYAAHQRLEFGWVTLEFQERNNRNMHFQDRVDAERAHRRVWGELFEENYEPMPPIYHSWSMAQTYGRSTQEMFARPFPDVRRMR